MPFPARYLAAAGAATALLALLAWWLLRPAAEIPGSVRLQELDVDSAGELQQRFEELEYGWPPGGAVPAVAVPSLPGDLDQLRVQDKKSIFFRTLAPLIAAENTEIRRQREFLQRAFADPALLAEPEVRNRVEQLAIRYRIAGEPEDPRFQRRLLTVIDVLPPALVLAQAANESAWGTSRFAQEANNLFGIWTWNEEQGLAPKRRDPDATHFVRIYSDLRAAVRNYMYTINTGGAYAGLRQQRRAMREAGKPLDAIVLAGGLSRYSQRGQAYVDEIRSMISYNGLDEIPRLDLRDGGGQAGP